MELYSEEETLAAVASLTRPRLTAFVEARIVRPLQRDTGPAYRPLDLMRLGLLCELTEEFELDLDSLAVTISLIDQLHGVRGELRRVLDAVAREAPEVQERIGAALRAPEG